ncbi:MAG: YhcN/YlaJ family sporulation lipoprotein [Bacillaceae bacterium]|nr:YhcN/YlaJ family sporulation lipoprotein [Bacillaceae bacterium]
MMKKVLTWVAVFSLVLVAAACNNAAAPDNTNGNVTPYGANNGLYDQDNMANNYANRYGVNNPTGTRYGTYTPYGNRAADYPINQYNTGNMVGDRYGVNNNSLYKPDNARGNQGQANSQIGRARVNANNIQRGMGIRNTAIYVDRNLLAQLVSNVVASTAGAGTVTTVVTDEEIFVAINNNRNMMNNNNGNRANNQNQNNQNQNNLVRSAKMAAASVSPAYYKVYVTTDNRLFTRINRLGNMNNTGLNQLNDEIDRLIRDMGGETDDKEKIGKTYVPDER